MQEKLSFVIACSGAALMNMADAAIHSRFNSLTGQFVLLPNGGCTVLQCCAGRPLIARVKHRQNRGLLAVDHLDTPSAPVAFFRIIEHSLGNELDGVVMRGCIIRDLHSSSIGKDFRVRCDMEVISWHRVASMTRHVKDNRMSSWYSLILFLMVLLTTMDKFDDDLITIQVLVFTRPQWQSWCPN